MDNLLVLIDAPVFSVQLLINGLLVGAIFALAAYGMALVWGVMNIINIAQGEFVILGGYCTYFLSLYLDINPLWTIPIAGMVLYVVGWLLYRTVIYRIVDGDLFISLLATFGISILLQQVMNEVFGSDVVTSEANLSNWYFADDLISVSAIKVVAFMIAVLVGILLALFLKRSRIGQAIRATAQNARAARIMGIDTNTVYARTFALNAAICGVAGSLVAMTWILHPYLGLTYTIRSFMIVILAGLGNLFGVIISGMGLAVAENFAGFIFGAEFQSAFVFVLLVVVLVGRSVVLRRQRRYLK